MQNNQTILSKVTACMAVTTSAAGLIWFFAAFVSAGKPVLTGDLPVIWAVSLMIYMVNCLILRKERPVFMPAAADILLAAVLYGGINAAFYGDSFKVCFLMCMCIAGGGLIQVYWENRGFGDENLLHMSQILLALAVIQMTAAQYMGIGSGWAIWTGGFAVMCLFGAMSVKQSGVRVLSAAGSAVVLAGTGAAAVIGAGPVSRAVNGIFKFSADAVKAALGAVYKVLAWLSEMMKPEMSGDFEDGYGFGDKEEWEEPEYGEISPEMTKVLIAVILLALAAACIFYLWKVLSARTMMKKPAKKMAASQSRSHGSLIENIRNLWKQLVNAVRTRILIARHPGSIAALLLRLERAAYLNPVTRRGQGETAREFITRMAEHTEDGDFAALLMAFADETDAAFYGRQKDILKEFSQHKKMLKTLKNSLTTRI